MANGQATVTFTEVNLDNCIKQGLEFTGYARCPNCKQKYSFQVHLKTKKKKHKYAETAINGKTVTVLAPETYDISIEFSGSRPFFELSNFSEDPEKSEIELPCVPCSGCTPRCEKLNR
jgi:hypothetical protein